MTVDGTPVTVEGALSWAGASATAGLRAAGLPRRQPPSAVMTSFASASLMRSDKASALNPPKTTEWGAPIRAHASIAIGSSGTMPR